MKKQINVQGIHIMDKYFHLVFLLDYDLKIFMDYDEKLTSKLYVYSGSGCWGPKTEIGQK